MNLTSSARKIGRRNFLKAAGGASAVAALGTTALVRGPKRGGPVRAALIGYGRQGRLLHSCVDAGAVSIVAISDIQPRTSIAADVDAGIAWYQDWRRMLQQERLEAVIVATPLWTHAEIAIACLEARKHVLCETAMAMNATECTGMLEASERNQRLLVIGYQHRFHSTYLSAYQNIVEEGLLGEVYSIEAAWHSYTSGRLQASPDAPPFDPRPWGYASADDLLNWRLFHRHSNGLMSERGSEIISLTSWYLNSRPTAVQAHGGIYSYKDGRDVNDHVFATLEYPNGRTTTLSLIQSNGFEGSYTQFMGTSGTLIIGNDEALFFTEDNSRPTKLEPAYLRGKHTVLDASASRTQEAANHSSLVQAGNGGNGMEAYRQEVSAFCGSIRTGARMVNLAQHASEVVQACSAVCESIRQGKRVTVGARAGSGQPVASLALNMRSEICMT